MGNEVTSRRGPGFRTESLTRARRRTVLTFAVLAPVLATSLAVTPSAIAHPDVPKHAHWINCPIGVTGTTPVACDGEVVDGGRGGRARLVVRDESSTSTADRVFLEVTHGGFVTPENQSLCIRRGETLYARPVGATNSHAAGTLLGPLYAQDGPHYWWFQDGTSCSTALDPGAPQSAWDASVRVKSGRLNGSPNCPTGYYRLNFRWNVSVDPLLEMPGTPVFGGMRWQDTTDNVTWVDQVVMASYQAVGDGLVVAHYTTCLPARVVGVRNMRMEWGKTVHTLGVDGAADYLVGATKSGARFPGVEFQGAEPWTDASPPGEVYRWQVTPSVEDHLGLRDSDGYAEDPVNTATGNLVHREVDLDFPPGAGGLEWSRTYNSRDANGGALGGGWTTPWAKSLAQAGSAVLLRDGDGRWVRFEPNGVGGWLRPEGFRGTLIRRVDGTSRVEYFDGFAEEYDAAGRLTQRIGWDGVTVTLARTGSEVTSIASSTGRSLSLSYSGGRLSTVTADDGRSVSYAYDAEGDLHTASATDGGTTTYATDRFARITSIVDADGKPVVANTYDTIGRVAAQTTPSGDTVTFAYDDATRRTTVTRAGSGSSVLYDHDTSLRLVSVIDPHGEALTKTWDAAGNLTSIVDRRAGGVVSTYDSRGNVLTRTEPEGVSTSFTWDASDRLTSATNGEAETTTFSYDGAERVPSTVTDAEGGATTYDVVGGLVESVTDADGVTLDLAWNTKRELVSVTDEDGGATTFAYDAAGNRTSATTPLGHPTTWAFDGRRRVISSTDAEGATESWQWSVGGRLTKHTDAEAHETAFAYDGAGRVSTVTDALGGVTTHGYDLDGNATSVTRPGSSTSTATYDPLGRRLSDTDPTGVTTTYGYDADGNLTSVTDEAGKAETRAWDLRGRLTDVTDRLGKSTTYTWDDADRLTSTTDPLGNVTSYAYDDAGRVLSRTAADGGVWQRAWTPAGRLDTETDPNGHVTDLAWDDVGRLDTVTDALGHVTDLTWDGDGRLTSRTTAEGLVTAFAYDDVGRIISTTSPAGGVTSTTWTPRGQVATEARPASGTRSFAYDALGRLTTATDANGEDTDWTWDARGNPLTRTDAKGGVASWTWDAADRMLTSTDPLTRTTTRTYDALGRPATVADPSGRSVAFAYDDAWRVSSLTYGDGSVVSYGWDDAGRRTSMTDAGGTTTFGWDPVGRMTSVDYPTGASLGFEWDDAGNRTKLVYPDATAATFTWDSADRLTGIAHPHAPGGVAYSYDDDGQLLTEALPGPVSRTYGWDDGRLASYAEARPEGTRTTTLTHDAADRVISETTNGAATSYDYDDAGQLVAVTDGSATTAYGYDAVGNRTTKQQGSTFTSYAYDAAHQLAAATRTVNGLPAGAVNAAHDQAGRLTSLTGATGTRTLSYDARGALASVATSRPTLGVVSTTSRTVDGDGVLRAATTTAPAGAQSTSFTWDPSSAVPEVATTTSGGVDVNHLYGMGRALALRGGQSDPYAQDAHGSTLAIGEAADLSRAADYDEFGVPLSDIPAADLLDEVAGLTAGDADAAPSFGYRGEMHLDGMVHLRAREYTPALGRFTTVDPLEGIAGEVTVANPYPYAANDPVNLIDPLGLSPLSDLDLRVCSAPRSPRPGRTTMGTYTAHGPAPVGCIPYGGDVIGWRTALELVGYVPFVGDLVDGGLCVGSLATENYGDAAFDCIAIVPVGGSLVRGAKHADEAVALIRVSKKAGEQVATGQLHHVISRRIARELEKHPTLGGHYVPRDPRFVTRAADEAAHRGYQKWHTELDQQIVKWLQENQRATPEQFEAYLRDTYSRGDLLEQFPNGF